MIGYIRRKIICNFIEVILIFLLNLGYLEWSERKTTLHFQRIQPRFTSAEERAMPETSEHFTALFVVLRSWNIPSPFVALRLLFLLTQEVSSVIQIHNKDILKSVQSENGVMPHLQYLLFNFLLLEWKQWRKKKKDKREAISALNVTGYSGGAFNLPFDIFHNNPQEQATCLTAQEIIRIWVPQGGVRWHGWHQEGDKP